MAKKLSEGRKVGSGRKPGPGKTLAEGRKVGSGRKKGSISKTLADGRKVGSGRKKGSKNKSPSQGSPSGVPTTMQQAHHEQLQQRNGEPSFASMNSPGSHNNVFQVHDALGNIAGMHSAIPSQHSPNDIMHLNNRQLQEDQIINSHQLYHMKPLHQSHNNDSVKMIDRSYLPLEIRNGQQQDHLISQYQLNSTRTTTEN